MTRLNPFPKKNIIAYITIMCSMIVISVLLFAIYLYLKTGTFSFEYIMTYKLELIFSIIMVMCGMMIMFIASLLNLLKMKKGWEEIAKGKKNTQIPEVWCPVLTSAKQAAEQFVLNYENNKLIESSK